MNTHAYEQKTKIVATVGPACHSKALLRDIILEGASVFRLNFSHGTHAMHQEAIVHIRELNAELNTHVCILQDLQGPKIRLRNIVGGQLHITRGDAIVITTEDVVGTAERLSTDYAHLLQDVHVGQTILINDGRIELKIKEISGTEVHTTVTHGGIVKSRQGLNLPDTSTSLNALTEKDKRDLAFGLEHEVEWVALSFVRQARDVYHLKELIAQAGADTKVIAKIEKPEALENITDIIRASDGIMVARGDLGVEIPIELVPIAQKKIVKVCNSMARPVIIATHMMESMTESTRPTRAEATDVANAVVDGADAVMLSAETASGTYPVLATRTMRRILHAVERDLQDIYDKQHEPQSSSRMVSDRLIRSACLLSKSLHANAIVSLTESGYSGFRMSSFRPKADIFIFSNRQHTIRSLNLAWGVRAFYYDGTNTTDQTIIDVENILCSAGFLKDKDIFVILTSMPITKRSVTNTIKVNVVEERESI